MPIHYGGLPCRSIKALREIAEDHGIHLVEDAAEALGARVNNNMVGTFGDSAMFSFCANKIITTGEGGMILTDSRKIHDKLGLIRSHGRADNESYFMTTKSMDYISLGFNWRMPTMVAALGLTQLEKIAKTIKMRRRNAYYLTKRLENLKDIATPNTPDAFYHVFQMYTIRVKRGKVIRDKLQRHLAERKIMSKVYFEPVHLTTFYQQKLRHEAGELAITERIAGEVLTLPMYPSLTEAEMNYIAKSIEEFFEKQNS
jgi:dTDP-4-amino-4,6-dideoxygalactose transaminase